MVEGYTTGDSKCPEKGDKNFQKWKLENSQVMSWLLNTMTNEIGENFMFYDTAKEIWDAVKETYSNVDNTSVSYLRLKAFFMTFDRENLLLLSILIYLTNIGSNLTYMKRLHGVVQKIKRNIRSWWKKIGFTSSYWG